MFYDIFTELCEERGVTPAKVRKDLGISQSTMASWKSRGLSPNAMTLLQISEYFGTTPAYLLGNRMARYPAPGPIIPQDIGLVDGDKMEEAPPVHIDFRALMSGFYNLNEAGQEKVLERIQELTDLPRYQRTPQQEKPHTEPPAGQNGHSDNQ